MLPKKPLSKPWPTGLFFLQIRSVVLLIGQPAPFIGHFQQRRTVLLFCVLTVALLSLTWRRDESAVDGPGLARAAGARGACRLWLRAALARDDLMFTAIFAAAWAVTIVGLMRYLR
jgi:hypothetical protein